MSGAMSPIRYTDIRAYAADHQLPVPETVELVQMLDATYFAVHAAAAEKRRAHEERMRR